MDLYELFLQENILDVRCLFDRYMEKYPSIEEYSKYYALLEKIIMQANKKDLYAYIVDYLFHDSYQNVYVNINEMLRYISIHHTEKLLPESHVEFYRKVLSLNLLSTEELLYFFNMFKEYNIFFMFYNDVRNLKDRSYKEILERLTDLTLIETSSELDGVSVYDIRSLYYKLLIRCQRPFKLETLANKSWYSLITRNKNDSYGREYDFHSFTYGYLAVDKNRILHVSERDLSSQHSDFHDCGTSFPNRILNAYYLTEYGETYPEIQILNEKRGDKYYSLKPDYIVSYDLPVKQIIVSEAKRLGIPIVVVNSKSNSFFIDGWLTNRKYNAYYTNPEFDKSVNFVLR